MVSKYLHRPRDEILTRERCFIREIVNDPAVPEASLAECRVEPGVTTELHRLSVAEWYFILRGIGRMEVAGESPFDVAEGDIVAIRVGASQCIRNQGDADLVFQCLCVPRFTPECYQSLEGAVGEDDANSTGVG
ncbi:MAG TPA: cupin domain-containing protein [Woeseiaceae bacterium]|nr:cupin domain-containing protein [Woeseiaceae bacterium]